MTDDLIAFLRARWDEEAADAEALGGEQWTAETRIDDEYNQGIVVNERGTIATCGVEGLDDGEVRARHIARNSPARVLADIAVKRLLAQEYEGEAWVSKQQGHKSGWTEGGLSARYTLLKAFAEAYEDHPDYRDDWTGGRDGEPWTWTD